MPGGDSSSSKVFAPLSVSFRSDWTSQLSLFPCSKYCCRSFFSYFSRRIWRLSFLAFGRGVSASILALGLERKMECLLSADDGGTGGAFPGLPSPARRVTVPPKAQMALATRLRARDRVSSSSLT